MKPEEALRDLVQELNALREKAAKILARVCPHETCTRHHDPEAYSCNLCGNWLMTDRPDGTGTVLVPHRLYYDEE